MTEQELRVLVRDAIARHAGVPAPGVPPGQGPGSRTALEPHVSHGVFVLPVGADTDGPCVIEPAVPCNHCGYCNSYGH